MAMSTPCNDLEFKIVKPFKLCFVSKRELGRSNITIGKPLILAPIITPKFYNKQNNLDDGDVQSKLNQLTVIGPAEKYKYHRTENQRYGWYKCDCMNQSRLDFKKNVNQLITEHLMTYEKIRE